MRKHHWAMIAASLFGISQAAFAEVGNLNNKGYGPTESDAEAKARKNIEEACLSRNGKVMEGTFKVTLHQPLPTGQHLVEVTMQCDIP